MQHPIFFGTYSGSMYRGRFDDVTGDLSLSDSVEVESPSYILKDGDIVYGVSETDTFSKNSGGLFSVSLHNNNEMKLISMVGTNGKHPCHLYVCSQYIFAANYSEGTLSVFERCERGEIKPSHISISHYGKSINPDRQKQAHIHFVTMIPDCRHLAVCDLGLDKVFIYPYSANTGISTKANVIDCPPGSGPRHLTFSRSGKTMYILTELSNTILVCKNTDTGVEPVQEISTLPVEYSGISYAAAIHISPDYRFIAASNRGYNSIAIYQIKEDETLEKTGYVMTGKEPRDFKYSPNGKWILSANLTDNNITVHNVEVTNEISGYIDIPSPSCIAF